MSIEPVLLVSTDASPSGALANWKIAWMIVAEAVALPAVATAEASAVKSSERLDELELAPDWLRNEVFESLRSVDQLFYLKLTASPLLPSGLKSVPDHGSLPPAGQQEPDLRA